MCGKFCCFILFTFLYACTYNGQEQINPKAIELNNQAVELMMYGEEDNIKQAMILLDKALELEPDYSMALFNKLNSYLSLGQTTEALATLLTIEKKIQNHLI